MLNEPREGRTRPCIAWCAMISSSASTSMPSTTKDPSSAGSMPGVSNGTARLLLASNTSGLRVFASRMKKSVRADKIRRGRAMFEEGDVQPIARMLVQEHVDHREQEGGVGFRFDRNPFGRTRAGDGQMGLDLNPLHAAFARIGMPLHAANSAGGLDIGAEGNQIVAQRGIGRHREAAVPQFAVEMLGVIALHALPRAETHIDQPPSRQERRQRTHIGGGRTAAAEARGEARIAGLVDEAGGSCRIELFGDQRQRLVPRYTNEFRILDRDPYSGWSASSGRGRDRDCRPSAPDRTPSRRPCRRRDGLPPHRSSE